MGIPLFKAGMIFVGWRRKDWKLVYYQPYKGDDVQADDNGLTPNLYFTNAKGEEESTMMEGEVLFLPHFALENCEVSSKVERRSMQYRNLRDAHALYSIRDPETFMTAMEEATKPMWRRWCSIMSDIHRYKGPLMKANERRRKKRAADVTTLRRAGVPESEIENNLSSDGSGSDSDSDSGYDEDVCIQSRSSKRGPMKPPPPRRSCINGEKTDRSQAKKRKRASAARQASEDIQMSGARHESMDFDPSPPERNSSRFSSSENLFMPRSQPSADTDVERRNRLGGYMQASVENDPSADEGRFRRDAYDNGDMSDDEALQHVMRLSQKPEEHLHKPQETQQAQQAQQDEQTQQTQENVAQTTEDEDAVSFLEDDAAWERAQSVHGRRSRSNSVSSNR